MPNRERIPRSSTASGRRCQAPWHRAQQRLPAIACGSLTPFLPLPQAEIRLL
jgi:hypothetical protein